MTVRSGVVLIAAAMILIAGGAYTEHGTTLHYILAGAGILFLVLGTLALLNARRRASHQPRRSDV
jgi:hypothetical protein